MTLQLSSQCPTLSGVCRTLLLCMWAMRAGGPCAVPHLQSMAWSSCWNSCFSLFPVAIVTASSTNSYRQSHPRNKKKICISVWFNTISIASPECYCAPISSPSCCFQQHLCCGTHSPLQTGSCLPCRMPRALLELEEGAGIRRTKVHYLDLVLTCNTDIKRSVSLPKIQSLIAGQGDLGTSFS